MRPERRGIVISLVERGWQAARECSRDLEQQGLRVPHIVKGRLGTALQRFLATTMHLDLVSVPRRSFWVVAGWFVLRGMATGGLRAVLVDNERSLRRVTAWVGRARIPVVMVRPGRKGYELYSGQGRLSRADWDRALGLHADRADF